ncbi:FAD-dependent oxidoreductase [Chitinimonas sp.]|uniref:FAD-dependent oxidoreductase n=1 Tax=Chitinimonas sp. TaxID=1934313 RepID=UPI0035AE5466
MAFDAVIIGGGFYGSVIAIYLAKQRGFRRVLLVERERALLQRASYHNQARVHNGYHYPRSFTTAYRSRVNLPKFVQDWPLAIRQDFTKLYAIARLNSKVTSRQFERFCVDIGASFQPANDLYRLFNPKLVENVYRVEEYAFDSTVLAGWAERELQTSGVQLALQTRALHIRRTDRGGLQLVVQTEGEAAMAVDCHHVFNCSYSGMNQLGGDYPGTKHQLKQEITEMALVAMPPQLDGLGITVMDGPFFSAMPFPARGLHSLSHVRYTPHISWDDSAVLDPYEKLATYEKASRFDRMIRDVARYMPAMAGARYCDSLFEVKTILGKSENDDGRPILFERHAQLPGCYSILGGKIDNIYDVIEKLDAEALHTPQGVPCRMH